MPALRSGSTTTSVVAGESSSVVPVITEVEVNANEASAANVPAQPVNVLQHVEMANLTVSASLLLPTTAFSATLNGKSVFPLVVDMKARTTVLNDATSCAALEKTRKSTEAEAKQITSQVFPDGTATPAFPRTVEAIMLFADTFPEVASETVVLPIGIT